MPSKQAKIFRDPLYNYVSIDRSRDGWLLEILDCPEMQRLRRIHQLGVSYVTYPGADHNRLAHSLGVVHLMQQALQHLERTHENCVDGARQALLAGALLHDVGHGPFSHLFEPCLGIDHEQWTQRVVLNPDSKINQILRGQNRYLPQTIAELIDTKNVDHPAWQKALLSSQLDLDRMDYLRRDSLFTGGGYGHFDHFRILNTFELHGNDLVWSEQSKFAIEEYIFARYYMYQNVYLHKTTRGFEKLIEAMWTRAKKLQQDGVDVRWVPVLKDFFGTEEDKRSVEQYLRIEEFTVLQQIQTWEDHPDKPLSFFARSFLNRVRFTFVTPPPQPPGLLGLDYSEWEAKVCDVLRKKGYEPGVAYCLKDQVKGKYNQPYFPEKELDDQSARNAIRLQAHNGHLAEISSLLPRLKPLTEKPADEVRYYVPADAREDVWKLGIT